MCPVVLRVAYDSLWMVLCDYVMPTVWVSCWERYELSSISYYNLVVLILITLPSSSLLISPLHRTQLLYRTSSTTASRTFFFESDLFGSSEVLWHYVNECQYSQFEQIQIRLRITARSIYGELQNQFKFMSII